MKKTIIYLLTIVFITSCINDSKKEIMINEQVEIINPFIGNWESLERIYPYKSNLFIKKDSTFHFEYGACLESGFSNGKWTIKDNIIMLNCFKTDSCMYLTHFGQDCILVNKNDTTNYIIEKTIPECNPKVGVDYIEFNNEEFYILNDTLIHIVKNNKLCPEIKNNFIKKIKNTI